MSPRASRVLRRVGLYFASLAVLVIVSFPLYGIVLTSIQQEQDIRSRDVNFIPRYIEVGHYEEVLDPGHIVPVREAMLNSFIVSAVAAVIAVALAFPAAYAIYRLPLPGRSYLLAGMVSIYLLPLILFVVPLYIRAAQFGLLDTFPGLVIPYVAFLLPFMIWILGSFLKGLPVEVEEAAMVDGATRLVVLLRIVLPLMRPAIGAGLLMGFILSWIEFLTPLLFTRELRILTVTIGLYRGTQDIEIGQLAAAAVLTALPVILLTFVFQRTISKVITAGAER